jgi:hypothetical protein
MADDNTDDDTDEHDGSDHGYSASALDPFTAAIVLIDLALNPKATKAALKKLVKLDKSIGAAEQKLAAVTAQAEETKAALAERAAELHAREAAISEREAAFETSLQEARDNLHAHYNEIAQAHRQLIHRVMASAGILNNWNPDLQEPPSWQQLRRMIVDLPDDLPAAPAAEVVSENVREDWSGNIFSPSTLTRSINKAVPQ